MVAAAVLVSERDAGPQADLPPNDAVPAEKVAVLAEECMLPPLPLLVPVVRPKSSAITYFASIPSTSNVHDHDNR